MTLKGYSHLIPKSLNNVVPTSWTHIYVENCSGYPTPTPQHTQSFFTICRWGHSQDTVIYIRQSAHPAEISMLTNFSLICIGPFKLPKSLTEFRTVTELKTYCQINQTFVKIFISKPYLSTNKLLSWMHLHPLGESFER